MAKPTRVYGKSYWMFKAPIELQKKFDEVLREKIAKGQIKVNDRNKCTYRRVGLALTRDQRIWSLLKEAEFIDEEDRKYAK